MTDYTRSLRLDKRLLRRRGWIDSSELERELGSLPDVASKIQPPEEPEPEAGAPSRPEGSSSA